MGTGKSTVGKLLSRKLGWEFADTDHVIEETQGKTIPDIFAAHGEAYFRQVESDILRQVLSGKRAVVATGGGAVLSVENRRLMREHGFVAALIADAKTIVNRVGQDRNRPLLQGNTEQKVLKLLDERKHAYDFADVTIDTSLLDSEEVARRILMSRQKWMSRA